MLLLFYPKQGGTSQSGDGPCMDHQCSTNSRISQQPSQMTVTTKSRCSSESALRGFKWKQSSVVAVEDNQKVSCSRGGLVHDGANKTVTRGLPPNFDLEVFKFLPEEIQKEVLSPAYVSSLPSTSTSPSKPIAVPNASHITENKSPQQFTDSQNVKDIKEIINKLDPSARATTVHHQQPADTCAFPGENVRKEGKLKCPQSADCEFPGNVDPKVFSELPPDVQRELMSEWKQQNLVLKNPFSSKPGGSFMTKDRQAAGKGNQANSLLKYFKPS